MLLCTERYSSSRGNYAEEYLGRVESDSSSAEEANHTGISLLVALHSHRSKVQGNNLYENT